MGMDKNALHLVESLLCYCGIDTASFDDDSDKVVLTLDDETVLFVVVDGQLIHLLSILGPASTDAGLLKKLLQESFLSCMSQGYRFAIEPASGELLISLGVQSWNLQPGDFIQYFEEFVKTSEHWMRRLLSGDEQELDTTPEAGQETPTLPRDSGLQFFTKV